METDSEITIRNILTIFPGELKEDLDFHIIPHPAWHIDDKTGLDLWPLETGQLLS